jgi:hypothetical protein
LGITIQKGRHFEGMSMPAWAPIVMKMNFVVVPSGTDPEGSTTKAIFVVIFFRIKHCASAEQNFSGMRCKDG